MTNAQAITIGSTFLGLELGSTRIKAVLLGPDYTLLPAEVIPGKTAMKTDTGPIIWTMFGPASLTATGI